MKRGPGLQILSLVSFILGVFFFVNTEANITGSVIKDFYLSSNFSFFLGVVFILASVVLFTTSVRSREATRTIEELLDLGVNEDEIDLIEERTNQYCKSNHINSEKKKEIYREIASVIKAVNRGEKTNNSHLYYSMPRGIAQSIPEGTEKIVSLDAREFNEYGQGRGRGSERYIFDVKTKKLLGVATHAGKNNDLRWRIRFY